MNQPDLLAGIIIKKQPSEREELPMPLPAQTEGQPIKQEDEAVKSEVEDSKAEVGPPESDKKQQQLPKVKAENGVSAKPETESAADARTTTASQYEELSLRPWASPSTPPSELQLSFASLCLQRWLFLRAVATSDSSSVESLISLLRGRASSYKAFKGL